MFWKLITPHQSDCQLGEAADQLGAQWNTSFGPSECPQKIALWNRGKTTRKASGKTVKGKGTIQRKRRKVMATSKEPNIQSTERDPKHVVRHEFARVGFFSNSFLLLSSNKYSPFSLFFSPGFLRNFVQGVFSLFDEFIMYVFSESTLKKPKRRDTAQLSM